MKTLKKITLLVVVLSLQSCVVRARPAVTRPHAKVVYVKAPVHHKIVVVKGKKYHYWNGKYHRIRKEVSSFAVKGFLLNASLCSSICTRNFAISMVMV